MKFRYPNQTQLHRKRKVIGILLLLVVMVHVAGRKPADLLYELTAQMLPVLTYEKEFGSNSGSYAASYEVPEWFYEDEAVTNGDTAMYETLRDEASLDQNALPQEEGSEQDRNREDVLQAAAFSVNQSVGTAYTREQLSDREFLTSRIFVVDSNTSMSAEELDPANLLDTDVSLPELSEPDHVVQADVGTANDTIAAASNESLSYKVLIYHTHGSESFADSRAGMKEDTVIGVGGYLAELLNEQYHIPTYHDETLYDVIDGQLDRSRAYENAYEGISRILSENPSIEVVIDLHRDGVDEETHLVTEVNGKPTAKIMFLNGVSRSNMNGEIDYLHNPNKLMNLAFSFQMYLAGKEMYGDYVRKIYVRSLRYNLHAMPRATLIEAGAQNNTIEEEKNAMEPLAAILNQVLRGGE